MDVVLMPPAVEPGLPPINISIILKSFPPSDISAVSIVLNPAVRAVTEANRDAYTFPPSESPAMDASASNR